jgi:hypothetical protein
MVDATSYWGADTGCPGTAANTDPKIPTCNGDGNGKIGSWLYGPLYEFFRAWQQLANAGFIQGAYTGVAGSGSGYHAIIGSNVPPSQIEKAGFELAYVGIHAGDAAWFAANYGHVILFGSVAPNYGTYAAALTTQDAYNLDKKIDDSLPAYGKIMTFKNALTPGCNTSDTPASSAYALSTTTSRPCSLIFKMGY